MLNLFNTVTYTMWTVTVIELHMHSSLQRSSMYSIAQVQFWVQPELFNALILTTLSPLCIDLTFVFIYLYSSYPETVVLYDCSQLGSGCSSCLAANVGTGFDCGWCTRSSAEDSCSVMENCFDIFFSRFSRHAIHCPLPVIRYYVCAYFWLPNFNIICKW